MKYSLTLSKWLIVAYVGACLGIGVTWAIIGGFAMMIMAEFFNIYFALLFFIVGSAYTYKLFAKKRI